MPLLAHQTGPCEHLTKILAEKGSALDASDTGTGKTYVAVQVAINLGLPVGIICPKAVIPSWQRVCDELGLKPEFITNYEKIRLRKWEFHGLVIWDEVHRCKGHNSLNAKMLMAAWDTKKCRCLCLSATAAQSPIDMRALGYVLGMHKKYDFWKWMFAHGAKKNHFGGLVWRGSPEHLAIIHSGIFPDRGVRVRISELGDLFPENNVMAEALDVNDKGAIEAAYEVAAKELEAMKRKTRSVTDVRTAMLRARQTSELMKVPLLVDMAKDLMDEGKSVVIFTNFNDTMDLLMKELGTTCVIRGLQKDEREKNINEFQTNKSKIIIANIQSGGVGISLHDTVGGFSRASLICPTYSAIDLKQALGRIYRAKGMSPCLQKIIYAAGTIEEKVCKSIKNKLANMDLINDGELNEENYFNEQS